MPSTARFATLALAALSIASAALAQSGAPATGKGLSITPYLGVLVPTADLLSNQGQVTKVSIGFVFGGRLGIGLGPRFGIDADVGYSPGSLDVSQGTTTVNQDVKTLTGSVRAALYLIPRTSPLWIGVSGGVGAVRHTFTAGGTLAAAGLQSGTNVGGVVGASAGIRLGRLVAFNFGVDDYLYNASFDVNGTKTSETKQNDFRFTAGVRVPFLGF